MLRVLAMALALFVNAQAVRAQEARFEDRAGDTYEIRLQYETESATDDGLSSGSSRGGNTLIERVIMVGENGVELEFDLPPDISPEDRAAHWQFPVRVLKPMDGPMQLLNAQELESRIDAWLEAANWPREVCGGWIFTWNAFKIECDPLSVLATLQPFDLRLAHLHDGAMYRERGGTGPVPLRTERTGANGTTYVVETPIDVDLMRRERAETDLVVAEVSGDPIPTLEAAIQARAAERISGTITTTLDIDPQGRVIKRTKVVAVEIVGEDAVREQQTSTETVERRQRPA